MKKHLDQEALIWEPFLETLKGTAGFEEIPTKYHSSLSRLSLEAIFTHLKGVVAQVGPGA